MKKTPCIIFRPVFFRHVFVSLFHNYVYLLDIYFHILVTLKCNHTVNVNIKACVDYRITGQMSVLKCPLVTFSAPLSHDPTARTRHTDAESSPMLHKTHPWGVFYCVVFVIVLSVCRTHEDVV